MNDEDPGSDRQFLAALTQVDLGEVDLIVTPSEPAARWAQQRGYRIVRAHQGSVAIYEIRAGATDALPGT